MELQTVALVALAVVAAGGALFALRLVINRRSTRTNNVRIQNVTTQGDVAGRDINKNR